MKNHLPAWSLAVLAAVGLGGCAVGPNYRPPQPAMPTDWTAPLAGGLTNTAPDVAQWWTVFDDPTLTALIERALQANHDLRIATARVREARALRGAALADFLPTVDANGSWTRTHLSRNAQTSSSATINTRRWEVGFDATWEIDVFGSQRRSLEAASAGLTSVVEDRRAVLVSLLAEVARNYFEVRSFQRRWEIASQNIRSQEESLGITQARLRAGLVSGLDTAQAEALLATVRSQLPTLTTGREAALNRLAVLLGQAPGTLPADVARPTQAPALPPAVPVGLPSDLLRRRPDVRRSERELATTTALIGVETAELFPKFQLAALGGFESLSTANLIGPHSQFLTAGPVVTWRLLEWPRIKARIGAQSARQEQALAVYERTVLISLEDTENALVAYAQEQQRFQSLQTAVEANRRALGLARELYTKGLGEFLNVLDAQRSLYVTEDQFAQSEWTTAENLVALYKALGGGWETPPGNKVATP